MVLKYINSQGKEINLLSAKIRVKDGNFSSYAWKYNLTKANNSNKVESFYKDPVLYDISIAFKGTLQEQKNALNEFTNIVEYDIRNRAAGKLIHGDYSINGYFFSSSVQPTDKGYALKTTQFIGESGEWNKIERKSFFAKPTEVKDDTLDYPYNYPYDYTLRKIGTEFWDVGTAGASKFEMIIFGPCTNPEVIINNHSYIVNTTLQAGEYLIITNNAAGPQSNVIIKFLNNGTQESCFNLRGKEQSAFESISSPLNIRWSGTFGFDLILFTDRSEPKWI